MMRKGRKVDDQANPHRVDHRVQNVVTTSVGTIVNQVGGRMKRSTGNDVHEAIGKQPTMEGFYLSSTVAVVVAICLVIAAANQGAKVAVATMDTVRLLSNHNAFLIASILKKR